MLDIASSPIRLLDKVLDDFDQRLLLLHVCRYRIDPLVV
jgi:hypothetical protein